MYLIKKSNVQGEAKAILQADFVRQSIAELFSCGGGVSQQGLSGAVHKGHR